MSPDERHKAVRAALLAAAHSAAPRRLRPVPAPPVDGRWLRIAPLYEGASEFDVEVMGNKTGNKTRTAQWKADKRFMRELLRDLGLPANGQIHVDLQGLPWSALIELLKEEKPQIHQRLSQVDSTRAQVSTIQLIRMETRGWSPIGGAMPPPDIPTIRLGFRGELHAPPAPTFGAAYVADAETLGSATLYGVAWLFARSSGQAEAIRRDLRGVGRAWWYDRAAGWRFLPLSPVGGKFGLS